jgi:DNA-damage-inducible protein D
MSELLPGEGRPTFELIKREDEKGEYWLARELGPLLEYVKYDNFVNVMKRAFEACKNSGFNVKDHFAGIRKMVPIGSGAEREIKDVRLSRYACYLIVQNADPDKEVVALGQSYFAVQTRIQEIQQMDQYAALKTEDEKRLFLRKELTEHNKQLMSTAKGAGVIDPIDYAIFQNFGYQGLYGGLDKKGIQKAKGLPGKANILDHMGSTELAANLFRATQTEEKIKKNKIKGKDAANQTHFDIGQKIRNTIREIGGTMPEDLPTEESIKKIETRKRKGNLPPADEK